MYGILYLLMSIFQGSLLGFFSFQCANPSLSSVKQRQGRFALAPHLANFAISWALFRTPAQQFRPVSEAVARKMIVLHLHNEFRRDRFPLTTPLGAPTARAAGSSAREPRRLDQ